MKMPRLRLSACAAHYGLAIASPFNPKAAGACVPSFPARPSQKTAAKLVGQCTVGSAGFGFVVVAPVVCNDQPSVFSTNSAYPSTSISATFAAAVPAQQTAANFSTLPFDATQVNDGNTAFNSNVAGRIVSVGLRIRYVGTELSRGGTIYGVHHPDHQSINGNTVSMFASLKECIKEPVTRKWVEIVASAIDPNETAYPDAVPWNYNGNMQSIMNKYPFSQGQILSGTGADASMGAPILGFIITGEIGNVFEWEVIEHVEYVGRPAQSMLTLSHADAEGTSTITEVAASVNATRAGSGESQSAAFLRGLNDFYKNNRQSVHAGVDLAAELMRPRAARAQRIGDL